MRAFTPIRGKPLAFLPDHLTERDFALLLFTLGFFPCVGFVAGTVARLAPFLRHDLRVEIDRLGMH